MPTSRSTLRPALRPKIVKKKTNKFVRWHADLYKRMAVTFPCSLTARMFVLTRMESR